MTSGASTGSGSAPGLDDGSYEVIVVDAARREGSGDDRCLVELAVTTGAHKGDVIALTLSGVDLDPVQLLGLPGVVEVTQGTPRLLLS